MTNDLLHKLIDEITRSNNSNKQITRSNNSNKQTPHNIFQQREYFYPKHKSAPQINKIINK